MATCTCPFKLLDSCDILPRGANKFDGPEETGWSMWLSGAVGVNIKFCPFCGGTLADRPEPWPLPSGT